MGFIERVKNRLDNVRYVKEIMKKYRARDSVYVNANNTLIHEMAKLIILYGIKKGVPIEVIIQKFKQMEKFLKISEGIWEENLKYFIAKGDKKNRTVYTEAEIGKYIADIVVADEKLVIEVDKTSKTDRKKVEYFNKKGLDVKVVEIA